MKKSLTLLIPAYNEEKHLKNAVEYYYSYLKNLNGLKDFEIIICVNGSTDRTAEIARKLYKKYKEVRYVITPKKGIGIAIKLGIEHATKNIITYMPGDGEIEAEFIGKALKLMKSNGFIIGTRRNSEYKKGIARKILSYGFNFVVSILLSKEVKEATSVKMFCGDWAKEVTRYSESDGFEWQIEIVYCALMDNFRIGHAVSNTLSKKEKSSVNPMGVAIKMFKACLKYGLKYRYKQLSEIGW